MASGVQKKIGLGSRYMDRIDCPVCLRLPCWAARLAFFKSFARCIRISFELYFHFRNNKWLGYQAFPKKRGLKKRRFTILTNVNMGFVLSKQKNEKLLLINFYLHALKINPSTLLIFGSFNFFPN